MFTVVLCGPYIYFYKDKHALLPYHFIHVLDAKATIVEPFWEPSQDGRVVNTVLLLEDSVTYRKIYIYFGKTLQNKPVERPRRFSSRFEGQIEILDSDDEEERVQRV